jgi:hypothetical protein
MGLRLTSLVLGIQFVIQHFSLVSFHRFQNFQFLSVFVRYELILFVLFLQKLQRQNIFRRGTFFKPVSGRPNYILPLPVCIPEHTFNALILSGVSYRCELRFLPLREDHKLQFIIMVFRNFTSYALRDRCHIHGVMYQ